MLLALFIISNTFAQTNLNNYKYVIVPKKFEFLKEANQYRLNELTEFLFNKYGFQALMEGDSYPDDLLKNRCLALKSNLLKDSGLFKTKISVELKDCNDQVVYTTEVGESREKEYQKAYNEAVRNAFKSFETVNYQYIPNENNDVAVTPEATKNAEVSQEIQKLKEELQELKAKTASDVPQAAAVKPEPTVTPVEKTMPTVKYTEENASDVLYAQPIENGYQLVDSSPKVVYKIKKTSLDNVFLVEGMNGTLLNKNGQWVIEYYENGSLKQKVLNIKF
jgi:hypothetical protein